MKKFWKLSLLWSVLLVSSMFVQAGEIDMLVDTLAEKGVITFGEAQQIKTVTKEEIKKQMAEGKLNTVPAWVQNLSLKGDARVRHQIDWAKNVLRRDRFRLRLRVGAETRIVSNVKGGFGLATAAIKSASISTSGSNNIRVSTTTGTGSNNITVSGSGVNVTDGEPRSTNYTLGDSLSKAPLMVDYAYLEYSPISYATLKLGKFKNPLFQTSDIFWDGDLNTDGLAGMLNYSVNANFGVFLNMTAVILDEISTDSSDPMIYAMQPGLSYIINDTINLKTGCVIYRTNVKGKKLDHSASTNLLVSSVLPYEYDSISPSLNLNVQEPVLSKTVSIYGDYIVNNSTKNNNIGYCAGLKYGDEKVSSFGQWSVKYQRRYLEQDAWLDSFPDSDSYGGGTNVEGNEFIVELALGKAISLNFDYYKMDKINGANSGTTPKALFQSDLVYKF